MQTAEIQRRFLKYFENNGHTVVPSAPLPAMDDPNLLFIPAGMVQFVPYFLGQATPPYRRATSIQKCIRTPDIDEVGKTSRHGTFFQMNGNFSFGDYFKEQAIKHAWALSTNSVADGGFGLDGEKIWATVYHDDDEAYEIWNKVIGLPAERIVHRGMADNYWSMGIPGPCGPCSELYYDRGPAYGPDGGPEVDEDRYLEYWNLVFMQYERGEGKGKDDFDILGELPKKNIDTGMGMERMAALLQGVDNMYEIDQVRPLIDKTTELTGKRYGVSTSQTASQSHPDDVRFRVVADHLRSSLMLISDGIVPSNEGRGYVLRRLMRRAIRSVRLLGYDKAALPDLLPVARDCMQDAYPEVAADFERISTYAYAEEDAFLRTLRTGTTILDTAVSETKRSGGAVLSGTKAFELHDTYGFPIDLTLEMAEEQGLKVDETGFRRLMTEQRQRAKADAQSRKTGHVDLSVYHQVRDTNGLSTFTGYTEDRRESDVLALIGANGQAVRDAEEGDEVEVILKATPFYAEGGGQQPDNGTLVVSDGELEIYDVQTPVDGLIVHRAKVVRGGIRSGETGFAQIDRRRRGAISRAHTATHLVHKAMRNFLGETATQAGSLNSPGRLRFDFNTPGAVSNSVLHDAEQQVNEVLNEDLEVRSFITSLAEAKEMGAVAMFGEKYGDEVRVVDVGDFSRELCGGTHTTHAGQIGMVKFLTEQSVGAGVRRLEALVGIDAFQFLAREHALVNQLSGIYKVPSEQVGERVEATIAQLKEAEKELAQLRGQIVMAKAAEHAQNASLVGGVNLATVRAPEGTKGGDVRKLVMQIRNHMSSTEPSVVAVVATAGGKASLVVGVNDAARGRDLSASELVKGALSGRGGGNDDIAQGGGVAAAEASQLLETVSRLVGQN
ncbi:alanine--tRNA ligase [Natronoglycomyces albus]|uniref:Alanine--tRNA ligase n=1 Tax=Natronoglycomyces albus TaxID=2811108 RepID=A0A895XEY1_9ACTN|nr:alanine--tRNA ligase [Natronoglycomyces albus]QSB03884.1 alanine--tRNA ligase [Natronoglycomyces albus]